MSLSISHQNTRWKLVRGSMGLQLLNVLVGQSGTVEPMTLRKAWGEGDCLLAAPRMQVYPIKHKCPTFRHAL